MELRCYRYPLAGFRRLGSGDTVEIAHVATIAVRSIQAKTAPEGAAFDLIV